jgi:hypothetical protein
VSSVRQALPRPEVLLDAIARLGPWTPSPAFPAGSAVRAPARGTAREAIESFVATMRDGDLERALLVAHPDLGVGGGVELSATTLASRMSSALGVVVAFRVDEVQEGSSGAEGTVEVQLAGGATRMIYVQLRHHLDAWRVSWVEGVGVLEQNPAGRQQHQAHLLPARRTVARGRRWWAR